MKSKFIFCALLLGSTTAWTMERGDANTNKDPWEMRFGTNHLTRYMPTTTSKSIYEQMREFNKIKNKQKSIIKNENTVIVLDNLNQIPKWKQFAELENIELSYPDEAKGILDLRPIDDWGHKHYGQTNRQKATWFIGGVAATVGIMKLYSYCFPKK